MKKTLKILVIGLFLLLSPFILFAEDNYLFINIDTTLLASDPDALARDLADWVDDNGGYFTNLSTSYVVLRFPWEKAAEFRSFLDEASDDVFSYSASATDLRESILIYKSGIEAREEILVQNLALVDNADFSGTLYLEQEILRLMSEIEQLKGQLRKAENDRRMAYVAVQINFQSQTLPENIPSSFNWINTLSFTNIISGGFYGKARGNRYSLEDPEGFALVDNRDVYRAVSPEGVRFQIRKGRNYPRKDLDFWSAAFVRQMEEGGYQKKDEGTVFATASDVEGYAVEWGLSMGNNDYLYLTAIVPYKRDIYIIEAVGEYSAFRDYRDSIYTALESFSP